MSDRRSSNSGNSRGGSRPGSSRSGAPRSGASRTGGGRSGVSRPGDSRGGGFRSESPRSSSPQSGAPRSSSRSSSSRDDRPRSNDSRGGSRGGSGFSRDNDRRHDGRRSDSRNDFRSDSRPSRPRREDGRRDDVAPRSDRPRSAAPRGDRPFNDRPRRDDDRRGSSRGSDSRGDSRGSSRGSAPRSDRPRNDRPFNDRPRRDEGGRRDDRPRAPRDSRGDSRGSSETRAPRSRPNNRVDERGGQTRQERLRETNPRLAAQTENLVEVDPNIDIKILPRQVLAELRNISPAAAEFCARHLAAAMYALEDDDAERAYQHAIAARSRAARLGCVREMVGISAYYSQKWAEALSEFRTFQRLTGDPGFLPLMADCERGLGRPQRALQIARSSQVGSLDASTRLELRIVASGARRDLGQLEAAIATLECPELHGKGHSEAVVRLKYAYAEALLASGRKTEARDWFVKTSLADIEDLTDAADRAVEITG